MPIYLGASLDIPRLIVHPVERRVVALQSLIQELTASWVAPALLWQRALGHLASFVDLVPNCRLLMRPLQLHFLRFFTPLSDSQQKPIPLTQEIKDLWAAWASPVRLREGKPFSPPPPPSFASADLRCLPVRLGSDSPTSSGFRHLVQGGVLGPYHSLELRAVFLALSMPSGVRAVGVVSSEGYPSLGRSHSGGGQLGSRLPVQGEVSPIRMESESLDFSEDLSGPCFSAGDRPFCVHPQLSTSQVLCPLQGSSSLEGGRTLLPVVRSSSVCLPTLFDSSHSSGEDRSGRSRCGSGGPLLVSRPWFPKLLSLLAGRPRTLPLQRDLVFQPMSRQPHPRLESLPLSLWPLSRSKEGRRAFLLELQSSQQKLLESPHELLTIPSWNAFSSGVTTSLVTPLLPL